jgi:hypothetical protein
VGKHVAPGRLQGERGSDANERRAVAGDARHRAERVVLIAFDWMTSVGRQPVILARRMYLD